MNSALLLMLVPLAGSLTAYLLWSRSPRLATLCGALTSGVLSLLALWLPVGEPIRILSLEIPVHQAFTILGREFIFETSGRPALVFLHLAATFLRRNAGRPFAALHSHQPGHSGRHGGGVSYGPSWVRRLYRLAPHLAASSNPDHPRSGRCACW
jgi:hypothetical protein